MVAITPSSAMLGARIDNVDLRRMDNRDFNRIHRALLDHVVIGIGAQSLSAGEFIAFARRFGEPRPHVLSQFHHPRHPEILVLSNAVDEGHPRGLADGGNYWHSDYSYLGKPARATALYALEIPPAGGDTLFANMYEAYDALPEALKRRIDGMQAVHNYDYRHRRQMAQGGQRVPLSAMQRAVTPDVLHPVVRTHPETRRKALYVNPGFTVGFEGLDEAASEALKAELFEHALRPDLQYRHQWRAGDVVIWDNRCSMHSATGGYTANRTLYRITIM